MQFAIMLAKLMYAEPKVRGPVYVSRMMKGREAAQVVADFKAQETIHRDHDRVISDTFIGCRARDFAHLNRLNELLHEPCVSDAGKNWIETEIRDMEKDIVRNGLASFVHCPNWQPRPWPGERND